MGNPYPPVLTVTDASNPAREAIPHASFRPHAGLTAMAATNGQRVSGRTNRSQQNFMFSLGV